MNKKIYEPCEIEILTFTDKDVMSASDGAYSTDYSFTGTPEPTGIDYTQGSNGLLL